MLEVKRILDEIENTSGRNQKEAILKKHESNLLLREVLKFMYCDLITTGLSKKKLEKKVKPLKEHKEINLMEYLKENNTGSDRDIQIVQQFINNQDEELQEFYRNIATKNMKLGFTKNTLNSVYGSGFIESFDVMKATSYDDNMDSFNKKAEKQGYIMMLKKNGIRGEVIKENGKVVIKSRQNKTVEGFIEIEDAFLDSRIPDGLYEGEILAFGDFANSNDHFKATDKIYSKKGIKKGLCIDLFDYVPLEKFKMGEDRAKCKDRKEFIRSLVEEVDSPFIKYMYPIYEGKDTSLILEQLKKVVACGEEGLMVALKNSPYKVKRTKDLLKVKEFYTIDLLITDITEGEGKATIGKMGSAIVDFHGEKVGVGSGWTMDERQYYFENPDELIGRVLEVKYKDITKDKDGKESLQFPVKLEIREAGKDVSYC